jgi:3,4-dihydroxy 2-butanone 4-phosphate synthase/GTP cyclohydrolase II
MPAGNVFAPIPEVIAAIGRGGMVVLVDDEDRENEGDLVMAAEFADERSIAFMAREGRGLICLPMAGELVDRLALPMMTDRNRSAFGTAFTVSIEAAAGVTTGISAADRAHTIRTAVAAGARPEDVVVPGHIFPLRAAVGGVLVRAGQTEGAVDLARMAGRRPAGVICEIMRPDGRMARLADLIPFCREHGLPLASIADLIAWREASEQLVEAVGCVPCATEHGGFAAWTYRNQLSGEEHLALVRGADLGDGRPPVEEPVLVRVHLQEPLDDVFAPAGTARRCLGRIAAAGRGVLLYLRPGTGVAPVTAGHRPAAGGVLAPREYGLGAQILRRLGVRRIRLLAHREVHPRALSGHGLEIVERITLDDG